MKITAKPLKGETFEVEVDGEEKVEDLKAKIAAVKPEFPADQTKLIYSGKILTDGEAIKEYGIKPGEFVVVMVSKPKPAAAAPAPAAAPAAAPEPAAAPAPAPAAAPAAAAPVSYDSAASALITGSGMEGTISSLMEMGFERADVERCLSAAFNNPDRAVEYLMSGIPEGILPPAGGAAEGGAAAPPPAATPAAAPAPTPAAAPTSGASPFPAMPTGGSPGAFPAMPTGGAGAGGGGGGGTVAALQELRNNPRFAELAGMVQSNPQMLAQILPALSQTNPGLVQAITENPEEFMRLLQETAGGGAGGGQQLDPVATMLAAAQQAQAGGGGMPGGLPPGTHVVHLSEAEKAAVERLTSLGFDRQQALQAYLACDKNEELAANFLFDSPMDED